MRKLPFLKPRLKVLSSRSAYAEWAERYPATAHNAFMQTEEATLRELLPDLRGKRVLDLACGTGRWGKIAQEMGAQVLGFDNSPEMLRLGVLASVAQADLNALPLPDACLDVIICGLAVGHLPRIERTLAEMARVLKPDGHALISDLHPYQAWQGAQRTFTGTDGKTYAVEHYAHSIADYHRAGQQVGLALANLREVPLLERPKTPPVVLVLDFHKIPML